MTSPSVTPSTSVPKPSHVPEASRPGEPQPARARAGASVEQIQLRPVMTALFRTRRGSRAVAPRMIDAAPLPNGSRPRPPASVEVTPRARRGSIEATWDQGIRRCALLVLYRHVVSMELARPGDRARRRDEAASATRRGREDVAAAGGRGEAERKTGGGEEDVGAARDGR